jgi:hypothetical protein
MGLWHLEQSVENKVAESDKEREIPIECCPLNLVQTLQRPSCLNHALHSVTHPVDDQDAVIFDYIIKRLDS